MVLFTTPTIFPGIDRGANGTKELAGSIFFGTTFLPVGHTHAKAQVMMKENEIES
jgi:hypothetical protein